MYHILFSGKSINFETFKIISFMRRKLGATLFLLGAFCTEAQIKTSDIDSIEIQGKFTATTFKNANQNISIITKEEILNSQSCDTEYDNVD